MIHYVSLLGFFLLGASTPSEEALSRPAEAGVRVVVDPATGKIIAQPTTADLEARARSVKIERRRPASELEEFALAGGGKGVFLDGWADHSLEVTLGPDGRFEVACVQGDDHAQGEDEATESLR